MRGRDSYGKERLYTFTEELSQVIMIILKKKDEDVDDGDHITLITEDHFLDS